MNRLVRFSTLFAICTLTGLSAMELKASAQTANSGEVDMTATVNSYCVFDNATNGTLGVDPSDLKTLNSTKVANDVTTADGAPGSIEVTCNDTDATINISSVTNSIKPTDMLAPTSSTTTVTGLGSNITSTNGAAGTAVAVGSTVTKKLDVNLQATYGENFKAGDYTFTVNLVATP